MLGSLGAFNIASYALLTHMVAQVTGYKVGKLVFALGDTHIYLNHRTALMEQLQRQPHPWPVLQLNPEVRDIDSFTTEDIVLQGYVSHPPLKMDMAV